MARQQRVATTYDSGDNLTAKPEPGMTNSGDWGNDTPQGTADRNDELLNLVMEDFKAARDYVKQNYQSDWEDYWKCYNGIRTRRGYDGISDDFVPETFTIVESVKANIAGGKPKFTFVPMLTTQETNTTVLNHLMDFYWDANRMTQKVQNWVQDMLVYGNGVLHVSWEGDQPFIQNIPLADFFVDPTATHMNNPDEPGYARYAGYRYLTNRDDLAKAEILNPDTGDMEPMYQNLADIESFDGKWDQLDKEQKESFIGSTLGKDAVKTQVEIIVYYTKKKKILIANRTTIIYEGRNPYSRPARKVKKEITDPSGAPMPIDVDMPEVKPFLPFAILRNYVDSSLFYAKGDVAVIIDRQETLNDVSNQKHDNITYVLNNMWQIDPQFSHLADQIQSVPGAVYPIPRGALQAIEKQVVTSEADVEMTRIQDEMRRATAADEVIQGATQQHGRTTATEVTASQNNATQRFTTKLNTLENEGYASLARILYKMVQIFVNEPMAVRVLGPDGTQWEHFDPDEYHGEFEPKVALESNQKAMKAEEGQKYLLVHQTFANSPLINQKEFARVYLEKVLDLPEARVKELLNVPPPPDTPPMPAPSISYSFRSDLMPDQTAQILAKEGVQTSQSDLMLGAGIDPATASAHLQDPNNPVNGGTAVEAAPGASIPAGISGAGGSEPAPPSMDTGDGPAGPTPTPAQG